MTTITVFTSQATLEGAGENDDIEVDEGEDMEIQTVSHGPYCMYTAILFAANDKDLAAKDTNLLQEATKPTNIAQMVAAEIARNGASNGTSRPSRRELAKVAIRMLNLPACICIEIGDHAVVDYNENIVDESDTIFILERMGGLHYDWLKRRGAAGGGAGGASLALRF